MLRRVKQLFSLFLAAGILMSVMMVSPVSVQANNTIYYVYSVNGDDNNNGTSTGTPWKTFDKVNSISIK